MTTRDGGRPRALSATQVAEVRRLRQDGETYRAIGARFGVPMSTVRRAALGESRGYRTGENKLWPNQN